MKLIIFRLLSYSTIRTGNGKRDSNRYLEEVNNLLTSVSIIGISDNLPCKELARSTDSWINVPRNSKTMAECGALYLDDDYY